MAIDPFYKTYEEIELEIKELNNFKYTNRDVPKIDLVVAKEIASEVKPEQIAAAMVEHIEKLNRHIRKVQDRLGKVRVSNRRLKEEVMDAEANLDSLHQESLDQYHKNGNQTPDELMDELRWYRDRNEQLIKEVDSYRNIACNIFYRRKQVK